jgi:5-methylcytosine-specific restriction endonuclease McrA
MPYKDPEKAQARHRAYNVAHQVEIRAYRVAHREEERVRQAIYAATHREEKRVYNASQSEGRRAWRKAHPEVSRASEKRRRARKAGATINNLSAAQWREIQAAQDHCCAHCQQRCKGRLTQDHILALSNGGSHTLQNVIGVCANCNSRKGTKPSPVPVQPLLLTLAPQKP